MLCGSLLIPPEQQKPDAALLNGNQVEQPDG